MSSPYYVLTRHVFSVMSGEGAEKWARAHQVEMCDHNELISGKLMTFTDRQHAEWMSWLYVHTNNSMFLNVNVQ